MEIKFVPNHELSLASIPMPDASLDEIRRFVMSFDAGPGGVRYVRGCNPEDWDDSPKTLTRLRSVLYAGFNHLSWFDAREPLVRNHVRRIREKVAQGELE